MTIRSLSHIWNCCFIAVAAILFVCLPVCAQHAEQSDSASNLAARENQFGFDLLRTLDPRRGNAFISPISLAQALSMLSAGAGGRTKSQIVSALHLGGLSNSEIDAGSLALRSGLSADPSVRVSIANALWANQGVTFRNAYADECKTIFDAGASTLDFTSPTAADAINAWVSRHTDGKITSIVSANGIRRADAVLTDAVYFHGKWTSAFDPAGTAPGDFTLGDGSTKKLSMMTQHHNFAATSNERFQAVKIPYGDRSMNMVIVLPMPGVSVDALAGSLSTETWETWTKSMHGQSVDLTLPRFHVDYAAGLESALKALGVSDAFSNHVADFSPMSDTPMYVSAVEHKSTLDVDESGTTATAATAITMMPMMAMRGPSPTLVIDVNHPFLCAIEDAKTGALLFLGVIRDPKELEE